METTSEANQKLVAQTAKSVYKIVLDKFLAICADELSQEKIDEILEAFSTRNRLNWLILKETMEKNSEVMVYFDDTRQPSDSIRLFGNLYGRDWHIIRNLIDLKAIVEVKMPDLVSFSDCGQVEEWKYIDEYEGIYQVSNWGRVKRTLVRRGTSGGILSPGKGVSGLMVSLRNLGDDKKETIHRLVAEAFLKKGPEHTEVNHIDGNRWNNHVSNLEWCTHSENVQHSYDSLERNFTSFAENHANSKTVSQYSKEGELVDVWGSVNEAGRILKIQFTNIAKCARGERPFAGGYVWKYEDLPPTKEAAVAFIKPEDRDYASRFFIPELPQERYLGYEALKWLLDYCDARNVRPPIIKLHTMSEKGRERMQSLLNVWETAHKIV